MANEVWVVAEHNRAELSEVTLEILGEARELAEGLDRKVCTILIGHQMPKVVETLASHGVDKAYVVEHKLLADYTTDAYTQVMAALSLRWQPSMIFFGATANGTDLATRLAARLKVPVATDCVHFELNEQGNLKATRPAYRDQVYITLTFTGDKPYLVTLRPGVLGVEQPVTSRGVEVVEIDPEIDTGAISTRLRRRFKPDPATLPLNEAEIVVAGGGGVGSKENWSLIDGLASALGASVGGSRVAADLGLIPSERVVGQSGVVIAPQLYIAAGISGATYHTQGMKSAKTVIAINIDRAAPIFGIADLKVVSDLPQLLPALLEEIRQARSTYGEETTC